MTTIADYTCSTDAAGNITGILDQTNHGYDRTFGYDSLSRLTTANSGASLWGTATPPASYGYTWDKLGNMLSLQLGPSRTATFSYSGTTPMLLSVVEDGWETDPCYDAAGNEASHTSGFFGCTDVFSSRNYYGGWSDDIH